MMSDQPTTVVLTWGGPAPRRDGRVRVVLLVRDLRGTPLAVARTWLEEMARMGWRGAEQVPTGCLV